MLAILWTLILIYRSLIATIDTAPFTEHLVLYLPFSLYLGWITLATIANVSVLQTGNGWDYVWLTAVHWTLLKLAVAGAIGAHMVLMYRDPVFGAVVVWGAYGISVMQSATPSVSGAALALSLLMALLVGIEFLTRLTETAKKRK